MEYRFTDTNKAAITVDVTLGQIEDLRAIFAAVLAGDVSNVSRWRVREISRKLADAQRQAADMMAIEAKALADKANVDDTI